MNITHWLNDMQRLNTLCGTDPESMSDCSFALAILDNMPQDDGSWRGFLSALRGRVRDYNSQDPPTPIVATEFIAAIHDEFWFRHRSDHGNNAQIFTAKSDADRCGAKHARTFLSTTPNGPNPKRSRNDKHCTNSHCGAQHGHDYSECIAYGGGSQGKYTDWWRGPWNIHLPLEQRERSNNRPPQSHPAFAKFKATGPKVSAVTYSQNVSRSNTDCEPSSPDNSPIVSLAVCNKTPDLVWNTNLDNELIIANLPILEQSLPHTDHCHHDSAANKHVFHDRTAFEHYEVIPPLSVKGFGRNLSTVAVGRGAVRLRCTHGDCTYSILLTNMLHIPAARSNLVSGVCLDKAGVTSTLGDRCITLSLHSAPIVSGAIHNDMYRLNLSIVRPTNKTTSSTKPSTFPPHVAAASSRSADFYTA
jgi:hypothetical protein